MGCAILLLGLLVPRVAMVLLFFLTRWFEVVFDTWLWPLLGFVFLPYATLAYLLGMINSDGYLTAGWLLLIALGFVADLAHWSGGYRVRRERVIVVRE